MNITLNPTPCRRLPDDLLPPGGVKTVQLSFKISPRGSARGSCPSSGPGPPPRLARPPPGCAQRGLRPSSGPWPYPRLAGPPPRHTARLAPEPRPLAIPTPGRPTPVAHSEACARAPAPGHTHAWPVLCPGGYTARFCPSPGPWPYTRLAGAPSRGYAARLCPSPGPWAHSRLAGAPPGGSQRGLAPGFAHGLPHACASRFQTRSALLLQPAAPSAIYAQTPSYVKGSWPAPLQRPREETQRGRQCLAHWQSVRWLAGQPQRCLRPSAGHAASPMATTRRSIRP